MTDHYTRASLILPMPHEQKTFTDNVDLREGVPVINNTVLYSFVEGDRDAVASAVSSSRFWVMAIPTMNGYSIGSFEMECGTYPALYATKEGAQAELDDCRSEWAGQIAAGERDQDDVFEGYVYPALWNGGKQTLTILSANGRVAITEDRWTVLSGL